MLARAGVTRLVAFALVAATVGVMIWRMRQGVDVTDEAFYAALPLRFALGDRPFIDELNLTQTGGLLIYPFVKIYTAIVGSAAGLILFLRLLYLVFFGCVGWSAYALARTRLSQATSLLVGVACLCVIPYGLPGLSYNTLAMGFFALGLFVAARWLLAAGATDAAGEARGLTRRARFVTFVRSPLVGAGFAHGAAAFAYPTMGAGAVATALAIAVLANEQRARATLRYVAGGLGFGLAVSPLLVSAGSSRLREVLVYTAGAEHTTTPIAERLRTLAVAFVTLHPQLLFGGCVVAIAMLLARRWPMPVAVGLPFLPLLARGSAVAGAASASVGYVACFAMFGLLVCLSLRDARTARVLLIGVAMPSALAGLATAWSSSNSALAAGIGLYPAAILGGIALAMFIDEANKAFRRAWLRAALELSPVVLVGTLLGFVVAHDAYYRERRLPELTAAITEGPYAGLYTTPETKADLHTISADIRSLSHGERALFFYDFPAGYLIAYRRPLVTSPWTFVLPSRVERDARFFRERARAGDLVVRDDARWVSRPALPPGVMPEGARLGATPLDEAVAERCDLVANGPGYSMYTVR